MTGSDDLKVALVGYGLGGSVFHAPLIAATPGLALSAVVTSSPERQQEVRRRYPGAAVLASVGELLAPSPGWDLVVVTVPNAAHFDVAGAAVAAGISVVVDKPVTLTAADAERLGAAAAARGASVIPYHNRRWDGDFQTAAALIGAGRLGTVWRFESRFERWKPDPPAGAWKQDPGQAGAGILFDLGPHLVDQALVLFGPPASVYAELASRRGGVVDDAFVALAYPDGPAVHLWASSQAAQLGPRFRILGSDSAYVKFGLDPQEEALRAGGRPDRPDWGEEPPDGWGRLGVGAGGTEAVPTSPGRYERFYAGVVDHLVHAAPPPVQLADAVAGLRVLEAAVESARTGAVVPTAMRSHT